MLSVTDELNYAARAASAMIDGENAPRIIAERAMHYIANPDPEFQFLSGDYYDVNHEIFLSYKKALLRLQKILPFDCGTKLWVPINGLPGFVTLAVQNGSLNRYWTWAQEKLEMPPEMARCFEKREIVMVLEDKKTHLVTALAPIENSLGDITAIVEITARAKSEISLSPAWS